MPGWRIRQAETRDAEGLTICMRAAYAGHTARLGDLPPLSTDYAEEIATCQVWVALVGDDIVGGLVLVPAADSMQLANVAVHPGHAGAGLGKALIALAETQAADQGFQEIRLKTHAGMAENIGLYQHLGWRVVEAAGDTVSMAKSL